MKVIHGVLAQVVVVSRNTTLVFDSEAELTQTLLGKAPLQALLGAVRNRTAEFIDHPLAMNELREVLEFAIAQTVASKLALKFQPPQIAEDDYIDALKYSVLGPVQAPFIPNIT